MALRLAQRLITPNIKCLLKQPQLLRRELLVPRRKFMEGYIPPSQYDTPMSKKFTLGHALSSAGYELIPIFAITGAAMGWVVFSICFAIKNKVDVVYRPRSRNNISRTMDLNHPYCVKLFTINQVYEPWPEMADIICRMEHAEYKRKVDVVYKTHSRKNRSRTMDLCHPYAVKLIVINDHDVYKPWPEMKCVQIAMEEEEERLKSCKSDSFIRKTKIKHPVICNPETICEELDRETALREENEEFSTEKVLMITQACNKLRMARSTYIRC